MSVKTHGNFLRYRQGKNTTGIQHVEFREILHAIICRGAYVPSEFLPESHHGESFRECTGKPNNLVIHYSFPYFTIPLKIFQEDESSRN